MNPIYIEVAVRLIVVLFLYSAITRVARALEEGSKNSSRIASALEEELDEKRHVG